MRQAWILLPLLSIGALTASDMSIDDVRFSYSPLLSRSFDVDGNVIELSDGRESKHAAIGTLDRHQRLSAGYYRSLTVLQTRRGAVLIGAELSYDKSAGDQNGSRLDGKSQMIDVIAGWAYELGHGWHLEESAVVGCGKSLWRLRSDDLVDAQQTELDDTSVAFTFEYGFRVGAFHTWPSGFQLGAEARYSVMSSEAKFADQCRVGGVDTALVYEPELSVHGLGFTLSAGLRF